MSDKVMNGTVDLSLKPPIESWLLLSSPVPLLLVCSSYLFFVLHFGPRWMEHRKPFHLDMFTRIYNVFQVTACTYFVFWSVVDRGVTYKSTWKCIASTDKERNDAEFQHNLYRHAWFFLLLRLIELVETIVFVLRKKQNQVSTLHVYHHISTVVLLWIFFQNTNNEMGIYICGVNSLVHVIMYSYYFLSSYKSLREHLKIIKPFITIIQLVQLFLILGHSIAALLPGCNQSKLFYAQIVNGVILIGFFLKFYVQSYLGQSKKKI